MSRPRTTETGHIHCASRPRRVARVVASILLCCLIGVVCLSCTTAPSSSAAGHTTLPSLSLAELKARGDDALGRDDPYIALSFYRQAQKQTRSDPGLEFRALKAAAGAKNRAAGLDAYRKLIELNPDAAGDAEVAAYHSALTALPAKDDRLVSQLNALDDLFFEYRQHTDADAKARLLRRSRVLLRPYVSIPSQSDVDVWRFAGYTAVGQQNTNLAAHSYVELEEAFPDYNSLPHISNLMSELIQMPLANRLSGVREVRNRLSEDDSQPKELLISRSISGVGIPRDVPHAVELWRDRIHGFSSRVDDWSRYEACLNLYVVYACGFDEVEQDVHAAANYYQKATDYLLKIAQRPPPRKRVDRASLMMGDEPKRTVPDDEFTLLYLVNHSWGGIHLARIFDGDIEHFRSDASPFGGTDFSGLNTSDHFFHSGNRPPASPDAAERFYTLGIEAFEKLSPFASGEYASDMGPAKISAFVEELGRHYIGRGKYTQGMKQYLRAAEQGNTQAMYNIGVLYWNGEGMPTNEAKAVQWYRKAARAGSEHARTTLRQLGYQW